MHPDWRTACFTATCTNASTWAAYGDEYRGVALVFRPQQMDGKLPLIPLIGATGMSAVKGKAPQLVRSAVKGVLHQVTYGGPLPEVEFFQSLGNLPHGKLDRAWYTNRAGERFS